MGDPTHPSHGLVSWIPGAAAAFAIGVGTTVLAGWTLDNEILKGAGHSITMKPNAAIGLIASGLALLWGRGPGARKYLAIATAVLAGAIGVLTLSEHLAGWDLGIDQLLFQEPPGQPGTRSPGRMGPNASTSLLLAGVALLALQSATGTALRIAHASAFGMAVLATIAVIGYLYGTHELYSVARYTAIAWPTATTMLVLAIGILTAHAGEGPAAALISTGPGGLIARRLLLPALVGPPAAGYIVVYGHSALLYDAPLGTGMMVVLLMVVLTIAIWRTAVKLDEAADEREAVQRERDHLLVRERAAREEVERSSRLKDEFLATMSHELRTPLNTLLGWTEMLRSDAITSERRGHAVDVIARNGKLLVRLVEDLLDVSRIATGRLQLQSNPVDLAALVTVSADAIAADAAAKGIQLTTHTNGAAHVAGDRERLEQIVGNLLSNAVKFTPSGGAVEAEITTSATTVTLNVRDTGQGIPAEFLPHVFDRFRQADGTPTREHGGLGIGLSIVRDLVEMQGGSVEASSDGSGLGSTFTVTFPAVGPDL